MLPIFPFGFRFFLGVFFFDGRAASGNTVVWLTAGFFFYGFFFLFGFLLRSPDPIRVSVRDAIFFKFFSVFWRSVAWWKMEERPPKAKRKKKKEIKKSRKSSDLGGTRPLTYSARRRVGHDGQKRKKMKKKAMKKEKREREWKVRGTGEMRRRSNYGAPPSPAKGTPHKKKNILEKKKTKKDGNETFQRLFLSAFRLQKKRKKEKETKSHRRKGWGFEIHARLISFRAGGNEKKMFQNVPGKACRATEACSNSGTTSKKWFASTHD